jgi:hypothetical protein
MADGPWSAMTVLDRATTAPIAVSQSQGVNSPARERTSGRVSRSGELLACQP